MQRLVWKEKRPSYLPVIYHLSRFQAMLENKQSELRIIVFLSDQRDDTTYLDGRFYIDIISHKSVVID